MSETVEFTIRFTAAPLHSGLGLAPADQVAEAFQNALAGFLFEAAEEMYEIHNSEMEEAS